MREVFVLYLLSRGETANSEVKSTNSREFVFKPNRIGYMGVRTGKTPIRPNSTNSFEFVWIHSSFQKNSLLLRHRDSSIWNCFDWCSTKFCSAFFSVGRKIFKFSKRICMKMIERDFVLISFWLQALVYLSKRSVDWLY